MRYQRTFKLQSSHFNNLATYQTVWGWAASPTLATNKVDANRAMRCLASIHGHNFKIVISLDGQISTEAKSDTPWMIDDVELSKIVMAWDNTNLSMHPDFLTTQLRATTETMAQLLFTKLHDKFGSVIAAVTVYETADIFATARGDV